MRGNSDVDVEEGRSEVRAGVPSYRSLGRGRSRNSVLSDRDGGAARDEKVNVVRNPPPPPAVTTQDVECLIERKRPLDVEH